MICGVVEGKQIYMLIPIGFGTPVKVYLALARQYFILLCAQLRNGFAWWVILCMLQIFFNVVKQFLFLYV